MNNEKLFELAKLGRLIKLGTIVADTDLSVTDSNGKTAVIHAAENNRYKVVGLLLDKKFNADVNARDNNGKTALMYACENGCYETVGLLLGNEKYGVDTTATDSEGKTALDYAQANGNKKTLKLFDKLR